MIIKPGDFVQHSSLSIYFEVKEVFSDFVICAARDPKDGTELVFTKNVKYCVQTPPCNRWVKLDRTKGFFDKFHPEGWVGDKSVVLPFSELKEGMVVIGTKGCSTLVQKNGTSWKMKGKQKTLTSKNEDTYHWVQIQVEGYKGES